MSLKLASNLDSLKAQLKLADAGSALGRIYERLSSGKRINKASDDSAGLALSLELNAKSRIYTQGIRNGNDGLSLLNIADSAIEALSSVVTRIRELSEQSANGSYSSNQRKALDAEAQQLSKEFSRISQSSSFNGIKLFDGSLGSGVRLQLGQGSAETVNASIGGHISSGDFQDLTSYATEGTYTNSVKLGDLNGDGFLDIVTAGYDPSSGKVTVRLGTADGTFGSASTLTSEGTRSQALQLGDLNGDGFLDIVTAGWGGGSGEATVRLGSGDGTFAAATTYATADSLPNGIQLGDLNNDGVLDLVTSGWDGASGKTTIRLGNGDGSFAEITSYAAEASNSYNLALGDLNSDGNLDIVTLGADTGGGKINVRLGLGDGTFGAKTSTVLDYGYENIQLADLNADGILDYGVVGNSGGGWVSVGLGLGNGSFSTATIYSAESNNSWAIQFGDLNGDGNLDLISGGGNGSDGVATIRLGSGNGSFGTAQIVTAEAFEIYTLAVGDLNSDGVLDLISAGSAGASGSATVRLALTEDGLAALNSFSLKTRADSVQAMSILDTALDNLSKQRGKIGAAQSRLNIAVNNLHSVRDNLLAAESRITDADIASEAANLIRTQILQQASTAILANANLQPQLALRLLKEPGSSN